MFLAGSSGLGKVRPLSTLISLSGLSTVHIGWGPENTATLLERSSKYSL